jgi:hypothetical protein
VVVLGITDPNCLEAMACGEALSLEEDMGLRRLTIGSDCLQSCVLFRAEVWVSMAMWCVRLKLHLQVSTLLFFDMRVGILIVIIWREGLHRGRLAAMFECLIWQSTRWFLYCRQYSCLNKVGSSQKKSNNR